MDFRTTFSIPRGTPKIDHASGIFLIGSCFVENIGQKLDWFKFNNLKNPTGIIFHPSPIRRIFQRIAENNFFTEKDIFEKDSGWQTLEAHSIMRRQSREECIKDLNSSLIGGFNFLKQASHVIISLGTAWGYNHLENKLIAANCHKLPQQDFIKQLLETEGIENDLRAISEAIASINKNIKIIITVSPVRHLKDGVIENQQSKAHLITAVHKFIKREENAFYFPSYELMMDDLRDYRFYTEDMLHPNQPAINYIWKAFSDSWISKSSQELNLQINEIQKALSHRVRAENSLLHKKFLTKIQAKIEEIHKKHPQIIFS